MNLTFVEIFMWTNFHLFIFFIPDSGFRIPDPGFLVLGKPLGGELAGGETPWWRGDRIPFQTVRVKGGMSLRNGMWKDGRNGIIMQNTSCGMT